MHQNRNHDCLCMLDLWEVFSHKLSREPQGLRVPRLARVCVGAFQVGERDGVSLTAGTWARAVPEPHPHW